MSLTGCNLPGATIYVWQDSPDPKHPYATWRTAAHEMQPALNRGRGPDDEVLVTNGVYATGVAAEYGGNGARDCRIVVYGRVRSVNGPEVTVIQGAKAPGGGNGDGETPAR